MTAAINAMELINAHGPWRGVERGEFATLVVVVVE
jgi:hypothetical protein